LHRCFAKAEIWFTAESGTGFYVEDVLGDLKLYKKSQSFLEMDIDCPLDIDHIEKYVKVFHTKFDLSSSDIFIGRPISDLSQAEHAQINLKHKNCSAPH